MYRKRHFRLPDAKQTANFFFAEGITNFEAFVIEAQATSLVTIYEHAFPDVFRGI